jgi:hypothetical protein
MLVKKLEEIGDYKGYKYLVVLLDRGYRCGYVRVPVDHPYFKKNYEDITNIRCHGGLTYSNLQTKPNKIMPIGYWLGFDCAHKDDLVDINSIRERAVQIGFEAFNNVNLDNNPRAFHKDKEFVKNECQKIINQLIKIKK